MCLVVCVRQQWANGTSKKTHLSGVNEDNEADEWRSKRRYKEANRHSNLNVRNDSNYEEAHKHMHCKWAPIGLARNVAHTRGGMGRNRAELAMAHTSQQIETQVWLQQSKNAVLCHQQTNRYYQIELRGGNEPEGPQMCAQTGHEVWRTKGPG